MQIEQPVTAAHPIGNVADVVSLNDDSANTEPWPLTTQPLKICILGYRSDPYGGGQGIYIKYLSKALVEAGHQVDVISGQPYPHVDPRVNLIKLSGMNLYETGLGSLRFHHLRSLTHIIEWTGKLTGGFAEPYCFGRRVVKYLRQYGRHYDIIHDNQCLSWGTLKLQQLGFPLVTTIHHPITRDLTIALNNTNRWADRMLIRRWYSFVKMQKRVASQLHHIVTISDCSRRDIAQAFDIPLENIHRVPCGIDIEQFAPRPPIVRKPFRLMTTASADAPLKGVRYLLEAVAALAPRFPAIELLLVCKPKPDGETERLIEQLQLAPYIQFVSGITTDELVNYYAQAQIAIVPSVYEGFGLPAGEAMACGVPLVATRGGALPEVVGDAGVLVPVRDSKALAFAIADLLEDANKRKRLAVAGRRRIEALFCWRRTAGQMVDYYRQFLKARRQHADG